MIVMQKRQKLIHKVKNSNGHYTMKEIGLIKYGLKIYIELTC